MTPVAGLRSLLVVTDRGFEPLGLVMGAGVFRIWRPTTCGTVGLARAGEPLVYTSYEASLRQGWETVVGRLESEAAAAGAHGVLGVSTTQTWMPGANMLQLQLLGTAVRLPGVAPLPRPFLSNLSMQEFLKLLVGGWVPCGLAWGVAAVHVHGYDVSPMWQGAAWRNAELPVPTEAVRLTRDRLDDQARATLARCRATGAVGTRLELERTSQACGGGDGVLIDGLVVATGVVRYRPSLASPSPALNLRRERSATP
jgi:uncharacterized protein YbjQ (UPF0145 family)